jgi:hypothetical protein
VLHRLIENLKAKASNQTQRFSRYNLTVELMAEAFDRGIERAKKKALCHSSPQTILISCATVLTKTTIKDKG